VRRATTALALLLLAVPACAYTRERVGDATFLRSDLRPVPGEATAAEVATALGPPAEVIDHGDELWFIYRSKQTLEKAFILRYVIDVVRRTRTTGSEDTLLLIFDRADRLRWSAAVKTEL
jgi:hypothetical protein